MNKKPKGPEPSTDQPLLPVQHPELLEPVFIPGLSEEDRVELTAALIFARTVPVSSGNDAVDQSAKRARELALRFWRTK